MKRDFFNACAIFLSFLKGVLFAVIYSFFFLFLGSSAFACTEVCAEDIYELTNKARRENGLSDLNVSETLVYAAEVKAKDMQVRDYWGHYTPDGEPPWIFFDSVGYSYVSAGENLARGFSTSYEVVEGWLNSPLHKDNLLSNRYMEIGVAVVDIEMNGIPAKLVVQMFGTPRKRLSEVFGGSSRTPAEEDFVNTLASIFGR